MALRGTLIWTCTLAVWFSSASKDESQKALKCNENQTLSAQETAELLPSLRNLTEDFHKDKLKECQGAEPKQCPEAEVPGNGGLACVTVDNKRLCKPMCNYGYDFGFLRRSRLYDECSEQSRYTWDTQYVGGNKLAVCNKELVQISGAKSAYFPKDHDCLTTKNSSQLQNSTLQIFINELKNQSIQGEIQYACLVCG